MARVTAIPTPDGVGPRVREGLVRVIQVWVEVPHAIGANPGRYVADIAVLTLDRWI